MRNHLYVWHCKRTSGDNAEFPTYVKPQKYELRFNHLTIQPASGYTSVLEFGEKVSRVWNGMASMKEFAGLFKEGDLMYIDGAEPDEQYENELGYGASANAKITSVREQNVMIKLIITKQ